MILGAVSGIVVGISFLLPVLLITDYLAHYLTHYLSYCRFDRHLLAIDWLGLPLPIAELRCKLKSSYPPKLIAQFEHQNTCPSRHGQKGKRTVCQQYTTGTIQPVG